MNRQIVLDTLCVLIGCIVGVTVFYYLFGDELAIVVGALLGGVIAGFRHPIWSVVGSSSFWSSMFASSIAALSFISTIVIIILTVPTIDGHDGKSFGSLPTLFPDILPPVTDRLVAAAVNAVTFMFISNLNIVVCILVAALLYGLIAGMFHFCNEADARPADVWRIAKTVNPLTLIGGGLLVAFLLEEAGLLLSAYPAIMATVLAVLSGILAFITDTLKLFGPYLSVILKVVVGLIVLYHVLKWTWQFFMFLHYEKSRGYAADTVVGVIGGAILSVQLQQWFPAGDVPPLIIAALIGGLAGIAAAFLIYTFFADAIARRKERVDEAGRRAAIDDARNRSAS